MLLIVLALGCDLPGKPDRASRPTPENQVADFDMLYARHCAGCHGADGKLGPAPPLNDRLFLAIVPDDELLLTVAVGRRGTSMPAFAHRSGGPLTDEQVQILAAGIKPRWKTKEPSSHKPPPYSTPADEQSDADAHRGRRLFARACAECHGDQGEGGHVAGAIDSPEFLQLISDRALRRIIITGRADLGMPNHGERHGRGADFEPLTSRDVSDLVALLAEWRRRDAIQPAHETPGSNAPPEPSQE
ncbi:MAG TPA: c-type cytochrome [Pirellulales bacterium]|nr:c-type cytochrome [Pirellulales bacterium]